MNRRQFFGVLAGLGAAVVAAANARTLGETWDALGTPGLRVTEVWNGLAWVRKPFRMLQVGERFRFVNDPFCKGQYICHGPAKRGPDGVLGVVAVPVFTSQRLRELRDWA